MGNYPSVPERELPAGKRLARERARFELGRPDSGGWTTDELDAQLCSGHENKHGDGSHYGTHRCAGQFRYTYVGEYDACTNAVCLESRSLCDKHPEGPLICTRCADIKDFVEEDRTTNLHFNNTCVLCADERRAEWRRICAKKKAQEGAKIAKRNAIKRGAIAQASRATAAASSSSSGNGEWRIWSEVSEQSPVVTLSSSSSASAST